MNWIDERSIPVTETGCFLWLGCQSEDGYGLVTINRKCLKAHRVAWEKANGHSPGRLHVLHKCDTPSCINPEHLMLGTNADNVADKVAKGRQAMGAAIGNAMCGERQGQHKLTTAEVVEIRSSALRVRELALMFGVSPSVISEIKNGKAWKHVEEAA